MADLHCDYNKLNTFVVICKTDIMVTTRPVPDLPLCLCVLKHRAPLGRGGGHLPAKKCSV